MNPIQNDKIPSLIREAVVPRSGEQDRGTRTEGGGGAAPDEPGKDDAVEVSDAARLLSASSSHATTAPATPEQARELASLIREQIQSLGDQALGAHSAGDVRLLGGLLGKAIA